MARILALMAGTRVENVIVGTPADYPGSIDVTELNPRPAAGWIRENGVFAPPPPAPAQSLGTKITRLALRDRIGTPALVAIELASVHNPAATPQQQAFAAQLRVMTENVRIATFIDLSHPDTRGGIQALEAAGLIPAGAAAQILDAPVQAVEVPAGL